MRYIILALALFLSTEAFAKRDWCEFNSDFAKKYQEARNKYAVTIRGRRDTAVSLEDFEQIRTNTGRWRVRRNADKWQNNSLSRNTDEIFRGKETVFETTDSGKVIIRPKDLVEGQEVRQIVYDTSGDYFRIEIGKVKNGEIKPINNWRKRYADINGDVPEMPAGMPQAQWDELLGNRTHFRAVP